MSAQSSRGGPHGMASLPTPRVQRSDAATAPVPDGAARGPTERTFVVQFDPVEGERSRLRGRVELVASGEGIRFRSLEQLVGFLASRARKRAKGQ